MKSKKRLKNRQRTRQAILDAAAEILVRDGPNKLDINKLARLAKVSRATIYLIFGTDAKVTIHEVIVGSFLLQAERTIANVLITSPADYNFVERLTAVLRATLYHFKENSCSGKIVLAYLDLKQNAFQPIHAIFKNVDSMISAAIEKGEIVVDLSVIQIRQILFGVMYGLLHVFYLEEEGASDSQDERTLSETILHREVLKVLSGLCSAPVQTQIESQIGALQKACGK